MRIGSVSNNRPVNSFKANPTGIAKNAKKAIKEMNNYAGLTIATGVIGAVTIIAGLPLLSGFTWLLPTFCFGKLYNNAVKKYETIEKPYKEIKQRAKKIYA